MRSGRPLPKKYLLKEFSDEVAILLIEKDSEIADLKRMLKEVNDENKLLRATVEQMDIPDRS